MRQIDQFADRIEYLCANYFPRIAEGSMALMLVGLAFYVADDRVEIAGLIQAPPYTPLWVFCAALVVTAAAHLTGIFMPAVHMWLARLGVRQRWLITPLFDDLYWRRACCALAIAEFGAYAGVVSQLRWTAWLFAVPYSLLMSAAYIRLGGLMDAKRRALTGSPDSGGADGRVDGCAGVPHAAAALPDAPAVETTQPERQRSIKRAAEVNRRWRESTP